MLCFPAFPSGCDAFNTYINCADYLLRLYKLTANPQMLATLPISVMMSIQFMA